jgi:DNA-binding GntR family transcriptional regulator
MTLPAITRRGRIADQVADGLRSAIIAGKLAPGARIVEGDIAEELGVSRTPVREAMGKLAEEGLVEVYPQVGSFVAPISFEAVSEAQFIREHLECAMIREAASKIDETGISELQRILDDQRRAADAKDATQFYALDEAMHAKFAEIAGRPGIGRLVQQKKAHLDRVRHVSYSRPDHLEELVEQHGQILVALASHDVDAAEDALRRHLRVVCSTIDQIFQEVPALEKRKRRTR